MSNIGVMEIFDLLESNKLSEVEETKKIFYDHFLSTKDNWLVNGLFDYYLSTNSTRAMDVLAGVREPHDKHLLDRLTDSLTGSRPNNNEQKVRTLALFSHVVRRSPTLLYKLPNHPLFKELLKLLKVTESGVDMLSLVSALLLLVSLLPMLPFAFGPYLQDIFEAFGRLAMYLHHHHQLASSPSSSVTSLNKDQISLSHLQSGLYGLFEYLYGMYPCNFIFYLRTQYSQREQMAVFTHVIRPMLDSRRMHSLLITSTKDNEVSSSRWKKMEHHDIVAECSRFALDRRGREDPIVNVAANNCRFTPIIDYSNSCTPVITYGSSSSAVTNNSDEDVAFWSPSMVVPPNSPPPLQSALLESRSTPSTPNNNNSNRSGTSPPEAAVEATPETTPVKDLRQLTMRQVPIGSAAVRAISVFGNGASSNSSRPSTPTSNNDHGQNTYASQRLSKLMAEKNSCFIQQQQFQHLQKSAATGVDEDMRLLGIDQQNGKSDCWQEDQEVSEIVNSRGNSSSSSSSRPVSCSRRLIGEDHHDEAVNNRRADLTQKFKRLRLRSQCQAATNVANRHAIVKIRKVKSCPDVNWEERANVRVGVVRPQARGSIITGKTEDNSTQTTSLFPYEQVLVDILDHRNHTYDINNTDNRQSPNSMLDSYIDICARSNSVGEKSKPSLRQKAKRRGIENHGSDETNDEETLVDIEAASQQIQLMQIQLQFERQRREVHAERNRRLSGKSRESRALQENNAKLTEQLNTLQKNMEELRSELNRSKREARMSEERYMETINHCQSKCVAQEQQNRNLQDRVVAFELELKAERQKYMDKERERQQADANLFEAAHQLKVALKAASRGEVTKRQLEAVQRRFILYGEAQARLEERMVRPVPMARQEVAQIQRASAEELSKLKGQLESKQSSVDAYRSRLTELESKEAKKDAQLMEQQRLLQEAKEQHEAELLAVESKYKAQVEINLFLESRILELLGKLEAAAMCGPSTSSINLASSVSPKERSPPLSASLASSSEGSLAFVHSGGTGIIMNDCCDPQSEIPNLQAIVEPITTTTSGHQVTTPSRSQQQHHKSVHRHQD